MIGAWGGGGRAGGLGLPGLNGKLDGTSIRVPTANVSVIDFKFDAARDTSAEEINELMVKAAGSSRFKGILGLNREPTVSCDFNHDPHSSTFDLTQTVVIGRRLCRLMWRDGNEWGRANR